jgi:hypothetical protein
LPIYKAGHIPMIGEWVALPIMKQAGSTSLADPIAEQYLYPVASRLIDRCDAVFRIAGQSKGADEDVRLAHQRGLPVYHRVEEIPVRAAGASRGVLIGRQSQKNRRSLHCATLRSR